VQNNHFLDAYNKKRTGRLEEEHLPKLGVSYYYLCFVLEVDFDVAVELNQPENQLNQYFPESNFGQDRLKKVETRRFFFKLRRSVSGAIMGSTALETELAPEQEDQQERSEGHYQG
ncbi:hypothetical protein ACJX0J_016684, partial [Zea mays]